jgi:hypothetical protein
MAICRCLPLLAAPLCALLAACGGSSSAVTHARLQTAIGQTRAIGSAHVVEALSLVTPQGNTQASVTGDEDFASNAGTTIVKEGSVEAHVAFRNGTAWLTINAPQFAHFLPSGKTWVQASTAELESLGVFHPLSDGFALLDALRGVKTIKQSGSNAATFTFSLAQAMAQTPASRRAALQSAIHASGDIQSQTGSVVLTSSGTVRSESLLIVGAGSNARIRLKNSLAISDVGERVLPTPPPAPQVASLASLPALQSALHSTSSSS